MIRPELTLDDADSLPAGWVEVFTKMNARLWQALLLTAFAGPFLSCLQADKKDHGTPSTISDAGSEPAAMTAMPQAATPPCDPYEGIPENQPVVHRDGAGEPDSTGWCLAQSTRGNFSVMLPGKFTDYMLKGPPTLTGGVCVFHTVMTKTTDGTEFNVLKTEIIGEKPSGSVPERVIDGFEKKGATIIRSKVTLASFSAERVSAKAAGVEAEVVLLSTATDEYMLAVQSPVPIDASLMNDIERFLQSFMITSSQH